MQIKIRSPSRPAKRKAGKFKVFLGGSCNPTTWREDFAIPFLKKHCITFYNPQVLNWRPELMQIEDQAKQSAELLFFVIDNQTRSTASMVEAAYLAGAGRKLILTVKDFKGDVVINNEKLDKKEISKLSRMHVDLIDIIEQSKIPVFTDIKNALKCTAKIINQEIDISKLQLDDGVYPIMHPDLPSGRCLLDLHSSYENVISKNKEFIELSDLELAFKSLTNEKSISARLNLCKDKKYKLQDLYVIFSEYLNTRTNMTASNWRLFVSFIHAVKNWMSISHNDDILDNTCIDTEDMAARDIYLGGTTNSNWRDDISIPMLRKKGVSFYSETQLTSSSRNSSTSSSDSGFSEQYEFDTPLSDVTDDDVMFGSTESRHLKPKLTRARNKCKVLLYVIGDDDQGMNSMIEAGNYIGKGCNIVLCIKYLSDNAVIANQKLSSTAIKDYNRARDYLSDIANRDGFPVFTDVKEATEYAMNKVLS